MVRRQLISPAPVVGMGLLIVGLALAMGYAAAELPPAMGLALVLAPPLAWTLIRNARIGLYLATLGILTVPYWYTLGTQQLAVFRVLSVLSLTALLAAERTRLRLADGLLALLVAGMVLSWLLQDNQPGAGKILLNELLPLLFYVAMRSAGPEHSGLLMRTIAIGGALGALSVIYEWHVGHLIFQDPTDYSWNASDTTIFRPGGIFGSPPGASTVLAVTALCTLPLLRSSRGWSRWAWTACLSLSTLGVVVTFTRASLIGLAAGTLVYLWLSRSRLLNPVTVLGMCLATAVVAMLVLPRLSQSTGFQQSFVRSGNLAARESYWKLALPIVASSPTHLFFGLGAEAAEAARQNGLTPRVLASAPVLVQHGTHNQYVLTLLEQGLIGLLLLVGWLATVVGSGIRAARRSWSPDVSALTGAVVAVGVIMLANNALLHVPSFCVLACAAGLLVTLSSSSSREPGTPTAEQWGPFALAGIAPAHGGGLPIATVPALPEGHASTATLDDPTDDRSRQSAAAPSDAPVGQDREPTASGSGRGGQGAVRPAVAQGHRLRLVVGDVDGRRVELVLDACDLRAHLDAQGFQRRFG